MGRPGKEQKENRTWEKIINVIIMKGKHYKIKVRYDKGWKWNKRLKIKEQKKEGRI